jgi:hypothetical protein
MQRWAIDRGTRKQDARADKWEAPLNVVCRLGGKRRVVLRNKAPESAQ